MRLSPRALVVGLAAGDVIASAPFAIAQDSGDTSGDRTAQESTSPPPSDQASWWDPRWQTIDDAVEAGVLSPYKGPAPSEAAEVDFAAEGRDAPAGLVEDCRTGVAQAEGTKALHCKAIIAIDQGQLAPGEYSDGERNAKLGE